jgi:hypothetical protein
MITLDKLAVYRKYGGDVDAWQRAGSPSCDVISGEEWSAITNLLQELTMYKRNLVSKGYGDQICERLSQWTADRATAEELMAMV